MLVRNFDIFNDVLSLKNLVDEYFDARGESGTYRTPRIELRESGDTLTASILAPGVANDSVNVELIDDMLQISIERKNHNQDANYIRRERGFGSFSKSVKLPWRVDPQSVKAVLKDGILTISMDRSADTKPRKIEIH